MRELRPTRSASIPSKHRGRATGHEMRGFLVVRRLDGATSPESNNVTSSLDGVVLPNAETIAKMRSSRLRSDLKKKFSDMERDQRSMELLLRLIKSGSFARDLDSDENRPPPTSPTTPFLPQHADDIDLESEPINYISDYVMSSTSPRFKPRPITSSPSTRFKKTIEELKNVRERFGVCMSVNGSIAKVRNVQQKNLVSRKEGRERLPALNGSSSSDSTDGERRPSSRFYRVVSPLGPWLALSGRKIQLKHQDHVERALDQPEPTEIQTHRDVMSRDFRRRTTRSAPPRAFIKSLPVRKLTLNYRSKFISEELNKSVRREGFSANYSSSFHGYRVPSTTAENPRLSHEIPEEQQPKKVVCDVTAKPSKPIVSSPAAPPSCHSDDSSRPSSSAMPRPVRSVVIKLPDTWPTTSPSTSPTRVTSEKIASPQSTNVL